MPNKHNWGYAEKDGQFFVGCVECGSIGKVFDNELEAKMTVSKLKRQQSGQNSVYNRYPKEGWQRIMRKNKATRMPYKEN